MYDRIETRNRQGAAGTNEKNGKAANQEPTKTHERKRMENQEPTNPTAEAQAQAPEAQEAQATWPEEQEDIKQAIKNAEITAKAAHEAEEAAEEAEEQLRSIDDSIDEIEAAIEACERAKEEAEGAAQTASARATDARAEAEEARRQAEAAEALIKEYLYQRARGKSREDAYGIAGCETASTTKSTRADFAEDLRAGNQKGLAHATKLLFDNAREEAEEAEGAAYEAEEAEKDANRAAEDPTSY